MLDEFQYIQVKINFGIVWGRFERDVIVFKGIFYVKVLVKNQCWKVLVVCGEFELNKCWNGIFNVSEFGSMCC